MQSTEVKTRPRAFDQIEMEHGAIKEKLRAATIRRANREVENPRLLIQADREHERLNAQIHSLKRKFKELELELIKARKKRAK